MRHVAIRLFLAALFAFVSTTAVVGCAKKVTTKDSRPDLQKRADKETRDLDRRTSDD